MNTNADTRNYRAAELADVLAADEPHFYRLQVGTSGLGDAAQTKHLNITRPELDAIAAVVTGDPLAAIIAADYASTSHDCYSVQQYAAPNDRNGNPRRCYVIRSVSGLILDAIDEGYKGAPGYVRTLVDLGRVDVSATTYREMLRCAAIRS